MKNILKNPVVLLVLLCLLPLLPLFVSGLPVTHDGQDHVARIANFYQSLKEGVLIPRWAGNLNWGYGHPILMFLYPLPSYIASFFHALGFSLVDSVKLVFGLSFVASALTVYVWMKAAFGKTAGIIGSLLYVFAPYRFVDLYVRGAIGEHIAFVFPPLVMYFLYQLAATKKYVLNGIGLSFTLAALILSHNAIAIMFLPVFVLYGIYLFFIEANKNLLFVIWSLLFVVLGFGLSSFFWAPAFFEGKYTLRDIVTGREALERFVPWMYFLYSPWNYGGGDQLTKFLGIAQWIGIVAALYSFFSRGIKKHRLFIAGTLIVLVSSLFIMTGLSKPVWLNISILQKFQFPWRFMAVSVFAAAVLGGIGMVGKRTLLIIYCLFLILTTVHMWKPKAYQNLHESFYTGIYLSTTDTGESSPIWSVRFMEHTPPAPMSIISGESTIRPVSRTSIKHEYVIETKSPSRIVENTLYFPGWNIYVDGLSAGIQFQDPDYRGLMTFRVTEGIHKVVVIFEDTKIRMYSNYLSLASLAVISLIFILWKKTK